MTKSDEIMFAIESIMKSEGLEERLADIVVCNAYLYAYKNNLTYFKDEGLVHVAVEANERMPADVVSKLEDLFGQIGIEGIRGLLYELLSGRNNRFRTPVESSGDSISELAIDLLDINDAGHIVMDFGSGMGNFLANVYRKANDGKFMLKGLIGVEINARQANISQMALSVLSDGSVEPEIVIGNVLDEIKIPYTRAYAFPPFGMRKALSCEARNSFLFPKIRLSNKNTAEWLFIDNMLSGLLEGRAVGLVTGMALFSNADIEYRNKLIESGWLEGIIELPAGSLSFTGIKAYMLVFSRGNKAIKFVDASSVMESKNRRYANLELPVRKIEDMYYAEGVKTKTTAELVGSVNLCPSVVSLDVKKAENGVELKKLADVFSGCQYTLGIFESRGLISNERTGCKLLTSGDIEDGVVNWQALRSVDMKDDKFDKYSVRYGDVIVTSKSSKLKTAVVDIEPEERILAAGGMLVVRPQAHKLDPTYLKMFLDSDMGQLALKSIQKGAVVVTITAHGLSTIEIPMIDIEKQRRKAEKYNEKLTALMAYKREIESIENYLKNMFAEEED